MQIISWIAQTYLHQCSVISTNTDVCVGDVLAIYCCVTNYPPKFSSLTQQTFVISQIFGPGIRLWCTWCLCLRAFHKAAIKVLGLCSYLKAWLREDVLLSSLTCLLVGFGSLHDAGLGPYFLDGCQLELSLCSLSHRAILKWLPLEKMRNSNKSSNKRPAR